MAGQQGQGGGGADNSLAPLWIALTVFIAVYVIWHFAHAEIIAGLFQLKLWEIKAVSLFTDGLAPVARWIKTTPAATVTYDQLADTLTQVGEYIRYPITLLMLVFAAVLYFSSAKLKFKKAYSMKVLSELEQVNWPQISPVIGLDLGKQDIHEGPWAMARNPLQFAQKHDLLEEKRELPKGAMLSSQIITTIKLKKDEASKYFKMQMGPYWTGIAGLKPAAQAMFAVFAARISGDRKACEAMLKQLAKSAQDGKLNTSGVRAMLVKYHKNSDVIKITQNHAFNLSVMASMLEKTRDDGVFACADFLWLKVYDRQLWYMLNSVGRQTPFVEVSGPFAHWLAEKKFGRRITVPMIDEAVVGLDDGIKEVLYKPDEAEG